MTNDEIAAHATDIANEIESVLEGHDAAACLLALSAVIGASATKGNPDFDGLMKLIEDAARRYFDALMSERAK